MNNYFFGGQAHSEFEQEPLHFDTDQPSAAFLDHAFQHSSHGSLMLNHENHSVHPTQFTGHSGQWASTAPSNQHSLQHSYARASVLSTSSSNSRFSSNSIFSQEHWRDSVASTNTTWSQLSGNSRGSRVPQPQRTINGDSAPKPTAALPKRPQQRKEPEAKSPFLTCVSRTKRSQRSTKEPRYFCTSCKEGFGEKYDWKRHEETYQERSETYHCDNCEKTYFLKKDFVHHHKESHRCKTCVEKQHADLARRSRKPRTGWGCGFCRRFDQDWTERCNHVASHFESGQTMATWSQTQIILSLLTQPHLAKEWYRLLDRFQEPNPSFGWSSRWTGRAEGYPDSDCAPQLQDLLEFFTPEQDAAALARLAYEMGHVPKQTLPVSLPIAKPPNTSHAGRVITRHPSPPDKELPPLPSDALDDASEMDGISAPTFQHICNDFMHWDNIISSIPEDDTLPDSLPMPLPELDFGMLDTDMYPNFHDM